MENPTVIIALAVVAILYFWYAGIIKKKNKAKEALSGIDVQLKKRSDLIPNILKIAKKYMEHEKDLITKVTELRSQADSDYDEGDAEAVKALPGAASEAMGGLHILAGRVCRRTALSPRYPGVTK